MQTMQQQRAKFALAEVKKAATDQNTDLKEYKSYASALPFMIHANGLGQAAAFYRSKGEAKGKNGKKNAHCQLYELLSNWLSGNVQHVQGLKDFKKTNQPYHNYTDLLEGITQENMQVYMAAQAEAMVFMEWVKRFADAFMQDDSPPPSS